MISAFRNAAARTSMSHALTAPKGNAFKHSMARTRDVNDAHVQTGTIGVFRGHNGRWARNGCLVIYRDISFVTDHRVRRLSFLDN